jgi:hypothetical protein
MAVPVSLCSLMGILALLLVSNDASAVVLVHDQFLETGTLAGKTPSPGPGAAWNAGAQTGVNAVTVVNTSASPVNNEVALIQTEAVNGEDIANIFADRATTATTYARFDFRLPGADNASLSSDADILAEGLFFVTLRGSSASTSQRGRVGVVAPAVSGYRMAVNADNSNLANGATFPQDLAFDTTYRAIFSYDASANKSKLWINPNDESSANVEHTGDPLNVGLTAINRIILRQHNSYNGKQFVDNVVVGTTFADVLNPPTPVPGDYNGNGVVDAADYVLWRKGGPLLNEVDTPGTVNDADYTEWRAHFGNPAGLGSSLAMVPEPAGGILAVHLCVLGAVRRNRLPQKTQRASRSKKKEST